MPKKQLTVSCPTCSAKAEYSPANPFRPFCSDRCKRIDLDAWASESYRIPGAPLDPSDPAQQGTDPGASTERH